ncbi:primase-helicase family protein [Caldimonas sp. KR1-144]|uniref:primase-helicase family protein n=1 Tax=Caldimonas sp. KR1-144 TaxID=3400911 RepID=UPI003C040035
MPHIQALSAEVALVKTYRSTPQGVEGSPYPMVRDFTSHQLPADTPEHLFDAIRLAASRGWCLLKGQLDQALVDEPRAGHTDPEQPTHWICLDFDGLDMTLDEALSRLGLADVTCIVQYSNSHGIKPGLRCHVFALLEGTMAPRSLKLWLQQLNLRHFKEEIGLNRIGTALRWPLDTTTCQNDKLLYVAPPKLIDLVDPLTERIVLRTAALRAIPGSRIQFDAAGLQAASQELLHELRKIAGYPKLRDSQFKTSGGVPYLAKPGLMNITGVKEARGYRYFNFNGGDSWAYYQPIDQPRFVHNFKGEPAYLLEEIAPEYFYELMKRNRQERDANSVHFAFHSVVHDAYYVGQWDKRTNDVQTWKAGNEKKAKDYLKQHGQAVPDVLPLMEQRFDPQSSVQIDLDEGVINTYRAPKIEPRACAELPECYRRLFESAVGKGEVLERWLQWLAFIVQSKDKTGMAWVLHGISGTGKGVIVEHVLKPLLGAHNVRMITMAQLTQPYNGWMENALLVVVDEAQLSALRDQVAITANLKSWISEPEVMIRQMYLAPYSTRSYVNFLILSNQPDPVHLDATDRRFHIGQYQRERLTVDRAFIDRLSEDLPDLLGFTAALQVELTTIRRLINNEDRAKLLDLSRNSVDHVAERIVAGDFEFLLQQLPPTAAGALGLISPEEQKFRSTLTDIATRALATNGQADPLDRSELHALLNFCVGNVPSAPLKFTHFLKHHRIYCESATTDRGVRPVLKVKWSYDQLSFARALKTQLGVDGNAVAKLMKKAGNES